MTMRVRGGREAAVVVEGRTMWVVVVVFRRETWIRTRRGQTTPNNL